MTKTRVRLADLGWDASWREALSYDASGLPQPLGPPTADALVVGRVTRVDRGVCTVLSETGPLRASLGGQLLDALARDPLAGPCTGDWCLTRAWPDGPVTVERLAGRRTLLVRSEPSRRSAGQALAANMDLVGVVVALHPEPSLRRLERLLAIAWESGAQPVVLLTKTDLVVDADQVAEDVRAIAGRADVISCSPPRREGLGAIEDRLQGRLTMALLGASGHGKSTLVNALAGADSLVTRDIRADGRGRHTSVRRELVLLPGGGALIDTPGLRGVGVQRDQASLAAAFFDIDQLGQSCRFRDCRHVTEPGCAVLAAVAAGTVGVRRWESWQSLQRELAHAEARSAARVRTRQPRKQPGQRFRA